jgi:TPR repeat protein
MGKEKKSLRFKAVIAIATTLLLLMVPVVYFSTATYSTGDPDKDYELLKKIFPWKITSLDDIKKASFTDGSKFNKIKDFFSDRWKFRKAFNCLKSAAKNGHAEAQFDLSIIYRTGRGVVKDKRKAEKWLIKSANNESPRALQYLALKYYQDPPKDEKKAIELFKKAVKIGCPMAANMLIQIYNRKHDDKEAFKWAMKSALMNDLYGQVFVADAFYNGCGVKKNYKEAVKWYKEAIKQETDYILIYHIGNAYYALGEKEKARVEWEKALKLCDNYNDDLKKKIQAKLDGGLKIENEKANVNE